MFRTTSRMFAVWIALVWVLFATAWADAAEHYTAGQSYFGERQFIEYVAGDLPVLIAIPHGGKLQPDDVPDREDGTFALDSYTAELADAIREEYARQLGGGPHLVYCRISRRKVDCNREIGEAAEGHPQAEVIWHEFHAFLDSARQAIEADWGRGLFIDLHGHGHPDQQLELGYLLTAQQLELTDEELNNLPAAAECSLRGFVALGRSSPAELIRGSHSFGGLMESRGFASTPSPRRPHPTPPYFKGAYNTHRHGQDAAPLAGLQVEANFWGVRDQEANRRAFARAFVESTIVFLEVQAGVRMVRQPLAAETPIPAPPQFVAATGASPSPSALGNGPVRDYLSRVLPARVLESWRTRDGQPPHPGLFSQSRSPWFCARCPP